jgi:hypothetical protein
MDAALALDAMTAYGTPDFVGEAPEGGYSALIGKETLEGKTIGLYGLSWENAPLTPKVQELCASTTISHSAASTWQHCGRWATWAFPGLTLRIRMCLILCIGAGLLDARLCPVSIVQLRQQSQLATALQRHASGVTRRPGLGIVRHVAHRLLSARLQVRHSGGRAQGTGRHSDR